jgi:hypothetical protein
LAKYLYRRETYKNYSAVSPSGLIPSIGTNVFGDILNNFGNDLIDYKSLKLSDIDLEFISTKAGGGKHMFLPERQIVRFQFLEILVKIGVVKYFRSKIIKNLSQAITKCFDTHLFKFMRSLDSRTWRINVLWSEEWDMAFKRYHSTVSKIYTVYSGRYAMPSKPHYMSIDEFFELVWTTKIVSDDFGQREIGTLYNLAMMTRVDELDEDNHMNMKYVEFLEAIGRIAQRIKLPMLVDEGTLTVRNYDSIIKSVSLQPLIVIENSFSGR